MRNESGRLCDWLSASFRIPKSAFRIRTARSSTGRGHCPFKAEDGVRLPDELIECGMGNAECGIKRERNSACADRSSFRIPNSPFQIQTGVKGNGDPRASGARNSGFDSRLPDSAARCCNGSMSL